MEDRFALLAFCITAYLALRRVRLVFAKRKRILHLKGFASQLDYSNSDALEVALNFIKAFEPTCIVWDGDSFALDSFTRIILNFAKCAESDECQFLAFVPEKVLASERIAQWERLLGPRLKIEETGVNGSGAVNEWDTELRGYQVRNYQQDDYLIHGLQILRTTGAFNVLVLGLGPCIAGEIKALNQDISFYIIDVVRDHKTKGPESTARYLPDASSRANIRFLSFNRFDAERASIGPVRS